MTVPGQRDSALGLAAALDPRRSRTVQLAALALLFTLLNAVKPLQVDDSAYYYYARQIAHDPVKPYGFEMFWWEYPQPANEVLAPPGLPYWWSLALRLFGENVFLWKLWLLPFSGLFVWSLAALFRRFARGLETPLLWLTVLSPTFLPSLNLMLDVPALALGLSAVVVFFRATARDSIALAAVAGLLAGLSMQTKYTGALAPAVILLYGFLFRQRLLALGAAFVAGFLFVSWELFVSLQHGQSHFLFHLRESEPWDTKFALILPFCPIVGGLTPPLTLLGLAALGARRWVIALVGGLGLSGYVLVAAVEVPFNIKWLLGSHPSTALGPVTLEQVVFGTYGIVFLGTLATVFWRLWARRTGSISEGSPPVADGSPCQRYLRSAYLRADYFVLLWLALELAGYFAMTPFPAVRRVMGFIVVSTLLTGRLAARTCRSPNRRTLIGAITCGGVALGLMFYAIDLRDAFAEKQAAEAAAAFIRAQDPDAKIWYVGHWGFQHYAERAGMKYVVPDGYGAGVTPTVLMPGDWLVKPDWRLNQQMIRVDSIRAELVRELQTEEPFPLPLRTVQCFYGGYSPLEHHEGPRVTVEIFRIKSPWAPRGYYR